MMSAKRLLVSRLQMLRLQRRHLSADPRDFQPKTALVLAKVSRYDFERRRYKGLSEEALARVLRKRGSDPEMMKQYHKIHEENLEMLVKSLEKRQVETKVIHRYDFTDKYVNWADIVFTAGGDGTFLMGASKLLNNEKPIVGVNTDPNRSSGHLCLPKQFTGSNITQAVERIMSGSFSWFLRKRLRITLIGDHDKIWDPAVELYNQRLKYPEYRYVELVNENTESHNGDHPLKEDYEIRTNGSTKLDRRVLPVLALNEVFLGESLSSRVSYLEVKFNGGDFVKTRNSGLCISTGTGSTSWTFNISKLTSQSVHDILKIVNDISPSGCVKELDDKLVEEATRRFNEGILFAPDVKQMAYTLRDPVQIGPYPGCMERVPRGVADKIEVKSRCFDACLVIDGSLSFKFNDGTKAILEMLDEDDLRTINLL